MSVASKRIRDLEEELVALRELRSLRKQGLSDGCVDVLRDGLNSRCDYLELRNKDRHSEPYEDEQFMDGRSLEE